MGIRPLYFVFFILILFILVSCDKPGELGEDERYEIAAEVKREDEKRLFRREELTIDRYLDFRNQILDVDDPAWVGAAVLLVFNTEMHLVKERPDNHYIINKTSGIVISDDIERNYAVMSRDCVVSTMKVKFSYINIEGDRAPYILFQHSTTWVKRENEWRVLFNHAAVIQNYAQIF